MDCIAGAAADQEKGAEVGTHAKYAGAWNSWLVWLEYVRGDDPYLQQLSRSERIRTLCAFLHAIRRGDFSPNGNQVAGETASRTINYVTASIIASGGKDPRVDSTLIYSLLLRRQVQSYKKSDPKTKHQKAIPPEVYRFILRRAKHQRARARAELLCGNLFFATRKKLQILKNTETRRKTN